MDTSTMTFEEILFNGRYHIIGGLIFLVFIGAFIREAIREMMADHARRRGPARSIAFGPMFNDSMLGHTMTDGGEPMNEAETKEKDTR